MPATLDLTPDELLTTTRAVRKRLDFDRPVPVELVRECIEVATQAPTGSNQQGWHWMIVTDADKRKAIGGMYQQAFNAYRDMPLLRGPHLDRRSRPRCDPGPRRQLGRIPRRAHGRRAGARHPLHRGTDRQHAGMDQRQLLGVAAPRRLELLPRGPRP